MNIEINTKKFKFGTKNKKIRKNKYNENFN